METKDLFKGVVNGIIVGFSIGIGFILANRLMKKRIEIVDDSDSFAGPHNTTRSRYHQHSGGNYAHAMGSFK